MTTPKTGDRVRGTFEGVDVLVDKGYTVPLSALADVEVVTPTVRVKECRWDRDGYVWQWDGEDWQSAFWPARYTLAELEAALGPLTTTPLEMIP